MRPRFTDAESAGTGFARPAIAETAAGVGARSYVSPGAVLPYTGTENCGLPRGGIVSFGDSHGSIFGCCLQSVNHEQPVRARRAKSEIPRFARDDTTSET